tara:strand:- start:13327 stop:15504 length:2178 start_codon:yes stop_codon:yes gene_type:complete
MAKDFNINDFLGGGSSSNFGNFGGASTPADLFNPNASNNPADAFDFQNNYLNSRGTGGFSDQYVDNVSGMEDIRLADNIAGGTLAALQQYGGTSFGSPNYGSANFSALETAINASKDQAYQTRSDNTNRAILGGLQNYSGSANYMSRDIGELLGNMRAANQDLVNFQNTLTPRISSEPGPGLEPFNRFNPTISQFEQMFGNQSARLPSAETFIQGETGFNDTPRFLESIRAEAQRNAQNFIGNPVTEAQLQKAAELNSLMGSPSSNFGTIDGNLSKAEYGNQNGPTDFEPRTVEEMNALLKMRTDQQSAAQRNADNEYVRGPEFQKAMAEMEKPFLESKAAYDKASLESQNELKNRLPFNTPFNYDKDGNKVSAEEQKYGPTAGEAAIMARGANRNATDSQKARAMRTQVKVEERMKRIDNERSAVAVKTFLDDNNIGGDLTPKGILAGIEAAGSPEAFVRMYANLQSQMSAAQNKKLDESTEGMARYGAKLKDSTLMKSRDSNETLMMGQNMDTGQWGTVGQDGVFKPEDITKWSPTSSANVKDARNKAMELQTGIFEESGGVGTLEAFKKSREMSQEGFTGLVTDIRGKIQNFVGQDLDPQAMRNAVAKAGFQALLGEIRIDVLGPGVLTEIDAQRLIEAMGGYGSTSDRETSLELIQQLINKKKRTLDGRITVYDQYRTTFDTLENELPFISADNIERVRMGDFGRNKNINNTVNVNSLFNP